MARASSIRDNNIDVEPNELGCHFRIALAAPLRIPVLDRNIATFGPTEFAQALHKCSDPLTLSRRPGRAQVSDGRELGGLLRPRRERPRRSAAEQRYEIAP